MRICRKCKNKFKAHKSRICDDCHVESKDIIRVRQEEKRVLKTKLKGKPQKIKGLENTEAKKYNEQKDKYHKVGQYYDLSNLIENEDYIKVNHKAKRNGQNIIQSVIKLKKYCPKCDKDCGFRFANLLGRQCNSCSANSDSHKTIGHNFYGDRALIKHNDRTILTRSTFETFYIKYLIDNDVEFDYEPTWFKLSNGMKYLPDLYLPETDTYIEIKGLMRSTDLIKIETFKKDNPSYKLIVLNINNLKDLGYRLSDYQKVFFLKIKGKQWKMKLVSDRDYVKQHGDDSAGITFPGKKEVHFNEKVFTLGTILHELAHCYFDSCNNSTSDLTPDQVEEVFCEIIANYTESMQLSAVLLYKHFMKSMICRRGDYCKTFKAYTNSVENLDKIIPLIDRLKQYKKTRGFRKLSGFSQEDFDLLKSM